MAPAMIRKGTQNGVDAFRAMAKKAALVKAEQNRKAIAKGEKPFLGVISSSDPATTREMVRERAIKKAKGMRGTYGPKRSFGM